MADKGFLDQVLDNIGEIYNNDFKGFPAGSHTVKIALAEDGVKKVKDGTEADIITVSVQSLTDDDMVGESTLWFHTEGGARMAVVKVGGLLVHNAPDDKKDRIRELVKQAFSAANANGDLKAVQKMCLKLLSEKLIDKEAFITAEPKDGYATTKYVDLWHYSQTAKEPEEKTGDIADDGEVVVDGSSDSELPEDW